MPNPHILNSLILLIITGLLVTTMSTQYDELNNALIISHKGLTLAVVLSISLMLYNLAYDLKSMFTKLA